MSYQRQTRVVIDIDAIIGPDKAKFGLPLSIDRGNEMAEIRAANFQDNLRNQRMKSRGEQYTSLDLRLCGEVVLGFPNKNQPPNGLGQTFLFQKCPFFDFPFAFLKVSLVLVDNVQYFLVLYIVHQY